ncbi:MAG: glycosyltransferase family 9 protein [Phycisphaerae bacterium]|nr:glycosyltransferase family 9 protein [Phycisphaerae bacterium]
MTATVPPAVQAPERVLLIKPSSLGDVVSAVPVLRGLRRTFPQARIAWLIGRAYAGLIQHDSDLNEVILFDRARFGPPWHWPLATGELVWLIQRLRAGRYQWAIDLQGLFRSGFFAWVSGAALRAGFADAREFAALFYNRPVPCQSAHTVDRNIELARALGIDARKQDMTLQVNPQADALAQEMVARHGLRRKGFVACVPPTRWANKRYPVRHWRAVIAGLLEHAPVVVLGGGGQEQELCQAVVEGLGPGAVNLAGQTDLPQMVAVIAAAAGVVCCDSAAAFIAPAVGSEVLTLLGPTRTERTGPYPGGQAMAAPVPCQGCLRRRCAHVTCMQAIAPTDVVAGALEMLRRCG